MSRSSPASCAALADGHLHLAALAAQEQLGQLVDVQVVLLSSEPVEHASCTRGSSRPEGLLEALPRGAFRSRKYRSKIRSNVA